MNDRIKVLIVDDDFLFRYAIREQMDWQANGYDIVAEAVNGADALAQMESVRPDLLITDMSMPQMDGVELIKRAHSLYPELAIVVMTFYEDFEYARESLRFGAKNYILKQELDRTDLKALLSPIAEEILTARRESVRTKALLIDAKEQAWRKLILHDDLTDENMKRYMDVAEMDTEHGSFYLLSILLEDGLFQDNSRESVYQGYEIIRRAASESIRACVYLMNGCYSAVLRYITPSQASQRRETDVFAGKLLVSLRERFEGSVSIGVSGPCDSVRLFPKSFASAQSVLNDRLYEGKNHVYWCGGTPRAASIQDITQTFNLGEALKSASDMRINQCLSQIGAYIMQTRPIRSRIDAIMLSALYEILSAATDLGMSKERSIAINSQYVREVIEVPLSVEEKIDGLKRCCDEVRLWKTSDIVGFETPVDREIRAIITHIDTHLNEDISLEMLAGFFSISPNYLSAMFKRATGMRLTEYINRVRIEAAKRMIEDTGMRVNEIAGAVGFSSTTYFCTVFQRLTGMTTSEYKHRKKV